MSGRDCVTATDPPSSVLQNRAFQQVAPNTTDALYAWNALNDAIIKVIADPSPVSSALPNSLRLTIPADTSGQTGFGNSGYYGIPVNSTWTYNASFYYKFPAASSFNGTATVALQGSTGHVYASASVPIDGSQTAWHQITLRLTPTASPNSTANNFTVTFNGADAAGQTIDFAMFSLFPPTFNDRENGMRIDISTALYEMKPSFFRLPGGNNLGQNWTTRWVWNATVGPLVNRPGFMRNRLPSVGLITLYSGLGLLEYMYFCEDLGMEPIMAVWAGYSLNGQSVLENDLSPYIQAAIDQINFVIGDPATNEYAALRASLGHPEPFTLNYVEIGNEDFFASESYVYRWRDFAGNLTTAFPQLKFIATTFPFNPILDPVPKEYDLHVYASPGKSRFILASSEMNTMVYFLSCSFPISPHSETAHTTSRCDLPRNAMHYDSLGEAAYMTGFERNSDIVFATSYAPLLRNIAATTPGPVRIDSASNIYPSTSYYVQQLFSTHRGSEYLPTTLPTFNGTLYWSVTRDTNVSAILVVNTDAAPAPMTFVLPFKVVPNGNLTVITGASNASNTPATPHAVFPVTSSMTFAQVFNYTAPAYSVSALIAYIL
ncbi:glycoside hydrolase family 51 protein [Lanmaoa asiatica]|nr:glycoside hydrolase family 51 protein [Lanmaoa asiatica]